ncbi:MAG: fumarate hydratase, partial [Pseudomonadota bacterium]
MEFVYQDPFPLGTDSTEYRLVTKEFLSTGTFEGRSVIKIAPEGLTRLAEEAFKDVSHLLRTSHLNQLSSILDDPEASDNDRYVALELLKNAVISAEREFPMCQDTGTAILIG